MVKDHTDRIAHTTAFVTPVVEHWLEREIAQWVHLMKDRSDDPSHHERTLLPRSYISLRSVQDVSICIFVFIISQAKEFGRKAVVASDGNPDDNFSRTIIEFMKVCERVK